MIDTSYLDLHIGLQLGVNYKPIYAECIFPSLSMDESISNFGGVGDIFSSLFKVLKALL